jgi:hypothetical protein
MKGRKQKEWSHGKISDKKLKNLQTHYFNNRNFYQNPKNLTVFQTPKSESIG